MAATSSAVSERVPTEQQYARIRALGSGAAGLSWTTTAIRPFLKPGWVTAERDGNYWHFVRLTPSGLHALAAAVERYGWPEFKPAEARVERRICADCGSPRYRFESITAQELIA
jgi:hypothetical protein